MIEIKVNGPEVEVYTHKGNAGEIMSELTIAACAVIANICEGVQWRVEPERLLNAYIGCMEEVKNTPEVWLMKKEEEQDGNR